MKPAGFLFFLFMLIFPAPLIAANQMAPAVKGMGFSDHKKPGRNFFKRMGAAIAKKKIRKLIVSAKTKPEKRRLGRLSMFLGITGFVLMLIPAAFWFALPAAIGALIFGIKSVDGNSNAEGIVGIVTGGITLSVFLIVGIVFLSIGLAAL